MNVKNRVVVFYLVSTLLLVSLMVSGVLISKTIIFNNPEVLIKPVTMSLGLLLDFSNPLFTYLLLAVVAGCIFLLIFVSKGVGQIFVTTAVMVSAFQVVFAFVLIGVITFGVMSYLTNQISPFTGR